MTTEPEPGTRIVLSWLREDAHENAERVLLRALDEIDTTPQRRSRPTWRILRMDKLALTAATAATLLVVAVVGYNLLPGLGVVRTGATPLPSATLLARGAFVEHDWGRVEFDATRTGSSVTGRMTVGEGRGSGWPITVDLQCTRTTEDGVIMIGGALTADGPFAGVPKGTLAWIGLERGSRDRATVGVGSAGNLPATQTTDCLAYLDAWLQYTRYSPASPSGEMFMPFLDGEGTVEFGP